MAWVAKRRPVANSSVSADQRGDEQGQTGVTTALNLLRAFGEVLDKSRRPLSLLGYESSLNAIIEAAVPSFCDWCAVELVNATGEFVLFAARSSSCTRIEGGSHDQCCGSDLAPYASGREVTLQRALISPEVQIWPGPTKAQAHGIVIGLHVDERPLGAVTFARHEEGAPFGPIETAAAEQVKWRAVSSIERSKQIADNRDAVRKTQRIASQLHQLIAASITVTALRSERDILKSLAASTRSVFDAETAVVALDSDAPISLRAIARRGRVPEIEGPLDSAAVDVPSDWGTLSGARIADRWLVAPILEGRDQSRGVIAVRRATALEFGDEDREVLTLLAQMAATALGASELSRTIQSSEARLRVLIETAPVGIVEADVEGNVRWWNSSASRVFAWPIHNDDSPRVMAAFPDDALPGLRELWDEVLRGSPVDSRDFVDIDIAGKSRVLTASAALLAAPEGEATGILTLIDDVTNNRELMAELRHAHAMEMRGQIASRIAHDFNNLLTLISGYAEILSSDLAGNERSLQMTREIQATSSRASMLTVQLQAIGRMTAPAPIIFNPVSLIQTHAELLERILGSSIELRLFLDEHAGHIFVDADQFEQTILNLANNARDAMPDGGVLSISVSTVTFGGEAALMAGLKSGPFVKISVVDSGVGMDKETRSKCFDPFFTTKGPLKGTGMGLSSARRLAEGSHGAIVCLSELEVGTTFELFLPMVEGTPALATGVVVVQRPRGSATVLIVDDDESLRGLMGRVLARNGYHVLEADSGERALEMVEESMGRIDLLLSDVLMGEMSGTALAHSLQGTNPALLVLLVSGTADPRVIVDLIPGTAAFLKKPFKPSQLIDHVHDLLTHRS